MVACNHGYAFAANQASAVELDAFPGDRVTFDDPNGPDRDELWPPLPPLEVRLRAIYITPFGRVAGCSLWQTSNCLPFPKQCEGRAAAKFSVAAGVSPACPG